MWHADRTQLASARTGELSKPRCGLVRCLFDHRACFDGGRIDSCCDGWQRSLGVVDRLGCGLCGHVPVSFLMCSDVEEGPSAGGFGFCHAAALLSCSAAGGASAASDECDEHPICVDFFASLRCHASSVGGVLRVFGGKTARFVLLTSLGSSG